MDRYRVDARIGEGGMAVVFHVTHVHLRTVHALKVHSSTKASIKRRFDREGRLQAQLRHENVVAVSDVVDLGDHAGLIMEYIEGPSLSGLMRRFRPPVPAALHLFAGLARGLEHAHDKGMVHRDLKPSNVLLSVSETDITPKLTDFGLAKSLVAHEDVRTRTGATLGTPSYMAPEQIRDASKVDHRADIYGLGCLLYVVLCGRPPYRGTDVLDLLDRIEAKSYADPRLVASGLPDSVASLLDEMLAPEPEDRPDDVGEILDRLAPHLPDGLDRQTLLVGRALQEEVKQKLASASVTARETDGTGALNEQPTLERGSQIRVLVVAPDPQERQRARRALKSYRLVPDMVGDSPRALSQLLGAVRTRAPYGVVLVSDGRRGAMLETRVRRDPRLSGCHVVRMDKLTEGDAQLAEALSDAFRRRFELPERSRGSRDASGQGTVLLVEDNLVQRTLVAHLLHRLGYSCVPAANGADALAAAERAQPDLVLLDVYLPDIDGMQLLPKLRAAGVRAPVVFLTADDTPKTRMDADNLGAVGFLPKPVQPDMLQQILDRNLAPTSADGPMLLDPAQLDDLRHLLGGGDDGPVLRIIQLFVDDLPAEIASWRSAQKDLHLDEAHGLARRLRPAAAHLGALALVDACDRLLALAGGSSGLDIDQHIERLLKVLGRTAEALSSYTRGLGKLAV